MMTKDPYIEKVEALLEPLLQEDMFLVGIKIKPTNNVKIYLDADSGMDVDKCIRINRALYKQLEEQQVFENGDFSLEVSSPGLDEPLKLPRQYRKNIGRSLNVILNDDSAVEGKLLAADEENLQLEVTTGKGKKALTEQKDIAMKDIKQAKIIIKF